MLVSEVLGSDNFALVGGGKAQAFKIGSSGHAFKILSDALYSDKFRAVVREILCNAVDAHIAAGIDKPVEVTLTNTELTIRDFGPGIPDDRMIEIYATYFGSTKTDDEAQTGGFGLGSKAPFAYTDHFTVISRHAGEQRVYALYVADEETDGAPAVKLMAPPVSTKEQGVTVTVPLKDAYDGNSFELHIRTVVRDGGMNVRLNTVQLETHDYSAARPFGFASIRDRGDRTGDTNVSVLYGNVVYPVTRHDQIRLNLLDGWGWMTTHRAIVLIAPPSSMAVTPSRESLSYTPKTIATINQLLRHARDTLNRMRREEVDRLITTHVATSTRLGLGDAWQRLFQELRDDDIYNNADITPLGHVHAALLAVMNSEYEDPIKRQFIKRFAAFHHSHRRMLQPLWAKKPPLIKRVVFSDDKTREPKLAKAEYRYMVNKLTRIMRAAGINSPLYLRTLDDSVILAKKMRFKSRFFISAFKSVAIVPSLSTARDRHINGFYIIAPKLNEAKAQKLVDLLARHQIPWKAYSTPHFPADNPTLEKPKVKREKKAAPPRKPTDFQRFSACKKEHRSRTGTVLNLMGEYCNTPVAYLPLNIMRMSDAHAYDSTYEFNAFDAHDWCKNYLPDTVIIRNKTELAEVQKTTAKPLHVAMIEEIEAYALKEPKRFNALQKLAIGTSRFDYRHEFFNWLMDYDMRGLYLALGQPYVENKDDTRIYQAMKALQTLVYIPTANFWDNHKAIVDDVTRRAKALKVFDVKETGRRFKPMPWMEFWEDLFSNTSRFTTLDKKHKERAFTMMEADLKAYLEQKEKSGD